METAAAEEHLENAAAKSAGTKVRADSNSDGVSGYRGLSHHGRNHEASYFRDSCYFHVTNARVSERVIASLRPADFLLPLAESSALPLSDEIDRARH
jgi:hypothetical protein